MVSLKKMKASSGKVRKRQSKQTKRRKLRGTVAKMLAVMEPKANSSSSEDPVSEFLVTGRTGRRNAMADILGPHASVTSGDLPEKLQSLTTDDPQPDPSDRLKAIFEAKPETSKESSTKISVNESQPPDKSPQTSDTEITH